MVELDEKVAQALKRALGADWRGQHFVVACSGGRDSVTLLHLVRLCVPPSHLTVAHFNHGLRGDASDADERFVAALSERLGIACAIGRATVRRRGEGALRKERRAFLRNVAAQRSSQFILTAHHLDDQLETFFMRLLRGTGVEGLSGMRLKSGQFIKPLLEVSRSEIQVANFSYREDASNADRSYLRNKVRHDLIPVYLALTDSFGGSQSFFDRFRGLTEELATVRAELRKMAGRRARLLWTETPGWIRMESVAFDALSQTWKHHMLRLLLRKLRIRRPTRNELKRIISELTGRQKRCDLLGGATAVYSYGHFFFQNRLQKRALSTFSADALGVEWEAASFRGSELRLARAGDRFRGKRFFRYLQEKRIPRPERSVLPVLVEKTTQRIIWHPLIEVKGVHLSKNVFSYTFLDTPLHP